jgi:hypothetical protein
VLSIGQERPGATALLWPSLRRTHWYETSPTTLHLGLSHSWRLIVTTGSQLASQTSVALSFIPSCHHKMPGRSRLGDWWYHWIVIIRSESLSRGSFLPWHQEPPGEETN